MANFQESKIVLADPPPQPTELKITRIEMVPPDFIRFELTDDVGNEQAAVIRGDSGSAVLNYINRGDFSAPNKPFAQRALDFLVNQGYISGSTTSSIDA